MKLTTTAPAFCNESTNLGPYLKSLVHSVRSLGEDRFLSVTHEIGYIDPLAILENSNQSNQPICYLERPANEFSIACSEFLSKAEFEGNNRFDKAKSWSQEFFSKCYLVGEHKQPGTGPTMFLTATFESDRESAECPPSLQIFLPRWQVIRKGGQHFLVSNFRISPQSSAQDIENDLRTRIDAISKMRLAYAITALPEKVSVENSSEKFCYESAVELALKEIKTGNISKVVLARQLTYLTDQSIHPFCTAHLLRERFPDCFTFCITSSNSEIMVGSTPETLLRFSGKIIETEAVAGSAPRGPSAGKDAHWGKTLLARDKEVHEHRVVIDSILRRLNSIGLDNCHEGKPRLLRLANLQHVRTPIRVSCSPEVHPFDALNALHPTPAMGGSPREIALPLIRKLEKAPRGLYSGVVGWFDNRGRGEFVVPIRCGKISQNKLTLYAGAGVVSGSNPSQEKTETDWKLKAMLDVITGKSDFSSFK